jgi:hypothetical protein
MILLLANILNAKNEDLRLEASIYHALLQELTHSPKPKVFLQTEIPSIKKFSSKFSIAKDCAQADVVIVAHNKQLPPGCKGKILFGCRYRTLKNNNVVGAFFWQKGRPNILFYNTRLQREGLKLTPHLQKYIDYEK